MRCETTFFVGRAIVGFLILLALSGCCSTPHLPRNVPGLQLSLRFSKDGNTCIALLTNNGDTAETYVADFDKGVAVHAEDDNYNTLTDDSTDGWFSPERLSSHIDFAPRMTTIKPHQTVRHVFDAHELLHRCFSLKNQAESELFARVRSVSLESTIGMDRVGDEWIETCTTWHKPAPATRPIARAKPLQVGSRR